jgi:hypothetical protein
VSCGADFQLLHYITKRDAGGDAGWNMLTPAERADALYVTMKRFDLDVSIPEVPPFRPAESTRSSLASAMAERRYADQYEEQLTKAIQRTAPGPKRKGPEERAISSVPVSASLPPKGEL